MEEWETDEEEWDGPRAGRRTRVAGIVLVAVFAGIPVLSLLLTVLDDGGLGLLLVGALVLAVLAGLYLGAVRVLQGSSEPARPEDDFWG